MIPTPTPADDTEGPISNTQSSIPMGTPMEVSDHPAYMLPPPTEGHDGTILGLPMVKPRKIKHRG